MKSPKGQNAIKDSLVKLRVFGLYLQHYDRFVKLYDL